MMSRIGMRVLPLLFPVLMVLLWALLCQLKAFPNGTVPSPMEVIGGFREEISKGRLLDSIIASLFRVACGFSLAVVIGLPLGLWLGMRPWVRTALLPTVNFLRSISPLAWLGFAILWFGIGDKSAIFLIFLASVTPLALATMAAVATVPEVYFRVAQDYGLTGTHLLTQVTLPAIMPQVITNLRVVMGLSWVVVVAAEMAGAQEGLGYLIIDARNGLRVDLLAVGVIVIGFIGLILDRLISRLTLLPAVRWGYGR